MSSKKWFVIGITGATCGGKTTLASQLHAKLKNSVVIHQDDYFWPDNDPRCVRIPELNHWNFEILPSMDIAKLQSDILKVIESVPEDIDYAETGGRPVLIVDGFLLFKCKAIADLCDYKCFLTLDRETCWERRKQRVYKPADVPGYFEKIIWPEYVKYETDVMQNRHSYKRITFIEGTKCKEEIFDIVFSEIKEILF